MASTRPPSSVPITPCLRQYFSFSSFHCSQHSRTSSSSSASPSTSFHRPSSASSYATSTSSQSACSSPRPLPVPPRRTSTLIRPLPRPPVPARAQSTPEPPSRPQEPLSPSRCSSESASSSKALLRLDIPATCPNEIHLKTPVTPLSPISFSFPGPKPLRKKREHTLERHMKQLGFVEAPPPLLSSKSFVKSHPPDRDVVLLVDYEVDQANVPFRSTSRCGNGDEFEVQVLQADEPVRIQRFSRKWVREKKGKRWTEKDFQQILESLRKLR